MAVDMPNEALTRIIIKGSNIQGVNLREKIKEVADKNCISCGFVRNIREKGTVEIIVKKSEAKLDSFMAGLDGLKAEKDSMKIDSIESKDTFFDEEDTGKEFTVKREDDLHEMFWALQGAGKVFEVMEKRRVKGQLTGLIYELNSLEERMRERIPYQPKSLENFIVTCPIGEKAPMEALQIIHQKCLEINYMKENIGPDVIRKAIDEACKGIKFKDKDFTFGDLIDHANKELTKELG